MPPFLMKVIEPASNFERFWFSNIFLTLTGKVFHLWAEERFHFPETFCGTGKLGRAW